MRLFLAFFLAALAPAKEPVFLIHQIGTDRSEAVAVFDFDRDGKLDVTSGAYWYKAPEWIRQEYREARVSGEFVSNCGEFAIDVNQDGYPDIIAAGWMDDGVFYFENPRQLGVKWPKVQITSSRQTEGLLAADIDGDGTLDILPSHWTRQPAWWIHVRQEGLKKRPVGETGTGHGVGFGDIDGDGKGDILTVRGWYRQINLARDQWEFHPDYNLHEGSIGIVTLDVNADGLTDFIYGKGHDYGLFWVEQKKAAGGKRAWVEHPIDLSFSQVHNVKLVDLNGDGRLEILAGKRYRGHNEKDPGSYDPLAIYYYTLEPGREPKFTRHTVAYNSIAGAGMQFVVIDLDGDGDLDIVTAGKSGQYWFENLTINRVPWQQRDILFNRYPPRW
ncbi:MAG: VCBS repeat-containing protein [Acidobacteria bacterium]|nr:VCBS repeat-containing protein [Acidobacteriota bacterium]